MDLMLLESVRAEFDATTSTTETAGFDYNVETGFQWGSFGDRSIRAWAAGGNIGWTLPGPVWRVRFGLQADALSGDKGQPDTLGTFNALFPRGAYFGPKFALIGPANLLSGRVPALMKILSLSPATGPCLRRLPAWLLVRQL